MARPRTTDGAVKLPVRPDLRRVHVTLARIVLGTVFVFASIEKIADPDAFAAAVANYRALPAFPALAAATVVPWVELLCGFGLLSGTRVRGSALLISGMLVVFTGLVISALLRGLDISCGCFTLDPSAATVGWRKVAENVLLLAAAGLVLIGWREAPRFGQATEPRVDAGGD